MNRSILFAFFLLAGLGLAGCAIPLKEDARTHYVILGFGVVSVDTPDTEGEEPEESPESPDGKPVYSSNSEMFGLGLCFKQSAMPMGALGLVWVRSSEQPAENGEFIIENSPDGNFVQRFSIADANSTTNHTNETNSLP